ncbi:MAG TPA: LemA family protein, partial [Candidatus Ozemobacteraceae bacterium]|nr:LemA family protein [Candidatus Ozemobacteraceae bacterium]
MILGTLVAAGVFFVSSRNHLIDLDEGVREQWSQIDTQLQRRSDLIPNLVNTVKGYAAHESKIFTEVAEARSRLLAAKSPADKA